MTRKPYDGDVELVWHGDQSEDPDIDSLVIEDIRENLGGLKKPSDLIFHTIFLGPTMTGESVSVWGEVDDDRFHCQYSAETQLVSLKEIEEGEENGSN